MSKEFFSKVENGTEYRIYMYTLSDGGFPVLLRSALDAADGVHEELVNSINSIIDDLENKVIDAATASGISYDSAKQALASTARSAALMIMERGGWALHWE